MTPSVIARVRFVARAAMLVGVLIVGGSAVLPAYADNQQFNGSWVLDPTASEDFAVALKKFNEMIKAQKHKHAKHFMNEQKTKGDNQFYSHEAETMTAIEVKLSNAGIYVVKFQLDGAPVFLYGTPNRSGVRGL